MNSKNSRGIGRRKFLSRACKAGASIVGAGAAAYLLYDKKGPQPGVKPDELVKLADFSIPRRPGKDMSIVKGHSRTKTVDKAIELLGGIERFVKKGERVIIKPNVAFAQSAMMGSTAHPDLVAEIVRLCLNKAGAKEVIVTDNPINDPRSCFTLSGIGKAADRAGAKVVMPRENLFKPTTLEGGKLIKNWPIFFEPFAKADKVIGISPVKDHARSGASMSMKNWYGLLGGRRNIFHQDINTIISELVMMVKPTLAILDGTQVMMTNGPTGGSVADLRRADTMIACLDCVAADSYGCTLLDLKVSDLPYLGLAEKAGAGITDYKSLKPIFAEVS